MPEYENYYNNLTSYHRFDPISQGYYFPIKGDKVIFPEAPLPENRHRVYQIEYVEYLSKHHNYLITFFTVTEGKTPMVYEKYLDELREIGMRKLENDTR